MEYIEGIRNYSPFVLDAALVLISALACLYCATLSRRLKKLNNLKSGVGASIVSLTSAIEQTHKAAQDAQATALQTVETLRHLLEKSEQATPKIEALITDLRNVAKEANKQKKTAEGVIQDQLSPTILKAQLTASGLLKTVYDINRFKQSVDAKIILAETQLTEAPTLVESMAT